MKIGDPITFVPVNGHIHHGYVAQLGPTGFAVSALGLVRLLYRREGVDWIRGLHAADEEEGAALLAANALLNPRAKVAA